MEAEIILCTIFCVFYSPSISTVSVFLLPYNSELMKNKTNKKTLFSICFMLHELSQKSFGRGNFVNNHKHSLREFPGGRRREFHNHHEALYLLKKMQWN